MAITISGENNNDRILAQDGVIDSISGFNIAGIITASSFTGDLTGDVTGNLTGNVTGNINNTTLLLQTGGYERIRITSTGKVGIGTNNPATLLHLSSSNPIIRLTDTDNNAYSAIGGESGFLYLYTNSSARDFIFRGTSEVARLTGDGLLGIGTNNPTAPFQINHASPKIILEDNDNGADVSIANIGGAAVYSSSSDVVFQTADTSERLRILSTGDVGIGSDSTGGARLRVYQDGTDTLLQQWRGSLGSTAGERPFNLYSPATDSFSDYFRFQTGNAIKFQIDNIDALCIDDGGKIGIGTDDPQRDVDIISATNSQDVRIWSQGLSSNSNLLLRTGNSGGASIKFGDTADEDIGKILYSNSSDSLRFTVNASERFIITSTGGVLIGESSARSYVDGAGYTQTPKLQVEADDNTSSAISLTYNSAGGAANRRASFMFARTADGTAVSDNSVLGEILFMGEGNSTQEKAASIRAEVDGTPGTNDMPGRLIFSTSDDGSDSPDERLRITSAGNVNIGGNYTQGTYRAQIMTGANKFISFTNAAHDEFTDEASAIVFSRQSDGAKELSGIFEHSNTSFGIATRNHLTLHAGGTSTYSASPERLRITSDGRLLVNSTVARNIGTNINRLVQVESSGGGAGIAVVRNHNSAAGASIDLGKSRGYPNTIVQSGDLLGQIRFAGADGTNLESPAAQIKVEVDGTPGENDMPGRLIFSTTGDSFSSPTERLRIGSTGSATFSTSGGDEAFIVKGDSYTGLRLQSARNSSSDKGMLQFLGSRGTVASPTALQNGDTIGTIDFRVYDGNSYNQVAIIKAEIDGAPGDGDSPSRIVFRTTGDGTATSIERLRIHSGGEVTKLHNPRFQVYKSGSHFQLSQGSGDIVYNTEVYDTGSNYNTSNGRFTAPVSGAYYFHHCLQIRASISGDGIIESKIWVIPNGGSAQERIRDYQRVGDENSASHAMGLLGLNAGDQVYPAYYTNISTCYTQNNGSNTPLTTFFEGYLVG